MNQEPAKPEKQANPDEVYNTKQRSFYVSNNIDRYACKTCGVQDKLIGFTRLHCTDSSICEWNKILNEIK